MKLIKLLFLIYFLLGIFLSYAQDAEIKVLHNVRNDSVILRWAPTSSVAWQIGNKFGYKITRFEIYHYGDSISTTELVLAENVKPLPLDEWESLAKTNKYAAIAAQAIYGDEFVITDPGDDAMGFYNQVSEQQNRYGFSLYAADMSLPVAEAMGLMLIDLTFEKNKNYAYRVELQQNPSDYIIGNGATVVDPSEIKKLPKPSDAQADFGDKAVKISWDILYDQGVYIAYIIERSSDGGQNFKKRNEIPFVSMSKEKQFQRRIYFIDSLEQNYKIYTYRLQGVTSFGEKGPASELLQGAGVGSARGITASFDTSYVTKEGAAFLQWYYPQHLRNNLLGFVVYNSAKSNGPFDEISPLLSPDQKTFLHKEPLPVNYYVVKAIGRDSVVTTSLPTLLQPPDSLPPSPPTSLLGIIDTTGNVFINWSPNPEDDIAGYRVFRANSLTEEFMQVTSEPLLFSEFRDSIILETLSKKIYYRVVAADHRDNLSEFSAPLELARPDKVPPAPPVFRNYSSDEEGIHLSWANSISDDISSHLLTRLDQNGDEIVIDLTNGQNNYMDMEVTGGISYQYTLKAIDMAGLNSEEARLNVQAFSSGYQSPIQKIKVKADRELKQIKLSWEYNSPGVAFYQIYRGKGDPNVRLYKTIHTDEKTFIDTSPDINNIYYYRIKAVFLNDDESPISSVVKVVY